MKMCQPHWDKLKAAIKARGIWGMVASDGKEAMTRVVEELQGKPTSVNNFDPLMGAHNAIVSNAMQAGGLYLMFQKEDGSHYCPLCEAEKHGQLDWVEKAADGAAEMAKELQPPEQSSDTGA